jgi:hypothetical protein
MQVNKSLTELDLCDNGLRSTGGQAVAKCLAVSFLFGVKNIDLNTEPK